MRGFEQLVSVLLVVFAWGFCYGLLCLFSPMRRCTWCKGTRRSRKRRWWGRAVACRHCSTTGRQFRLAAPLVHRWRQDIRAQRKERDQ